MRKNKGARVRLPDAEVKSPVNAGLVPGTNVNEKQCPDNVLIQCFRYLHPVGKGVCTREHWQNLYHPTTTACRLMWGINLSGMNYKDGGEEMASG